MKPVVKLIISIAITLAVGAVSSLFTASSVAGWFATINKPSFNPPNWVFAPVWTTLYILMGIACWLVWKSNADGKIKTIAIGLYAVQLTLNFLWSFIFFYAHETGLALVEVMLLWLMIVLTIIWFSKISSLAALLMVPYICWVSFATVLNFYIWKLN
jgi:tryptophan-rich sensory protein